MTHHEFEDRIGREATQEEYAYADALYLSARNINKDDFCKEYKMFMSSQTVKEMFEELQFEEKRAAKLKAQQQQTIDLLIKTHHETDAEPLRVHAILLAGEKQYLLRKIALGLEFDKTDYDMCGNIMEQAKDNF
ncbi:MAG: hypothetical protein HUK04_00235 [Bacteroidaceae bacterium]|nr:hypothetical protein [Bacteroidaceae bacterium]